MTVINDIVACLRSRTPVVALDAPAAEELVLVEAFALAISLLKQGHEVFTWSEASGLEQLTLTPSGIVRDEARMAASASAGFGGPNAVLDHIRKSARDEAGHMQVFILLDAQVHLTGASPAQSSAIRRVKELALTLKRTCTSVLLMGDGIKLDHSLESLVPVFKEGLPTADHLMQTLETVLEDLEPTKFGLNASLAAATDAKQAWMDAVVAAALGLTCEEFGDALRLAGFKHQGLDANAVDVIADRKMAKLRRMGADFAAAPDVIVGGLDQLMAWVSSRRKLLTPEAIQADMPLPKGLLLVGVPGTGKSLVAKSIGAAWGLPVMSLDVGALYGGIVGQTEQNVRKLLETADACAPCVLLIDELEKALAGASGHNGDSGVSQRLFGTLLSWMNDHRSRVFVVATANDVSRLPAELKRKGRFDEIFMVGLPTTSERGAILRSHLEKQQLEVDTKVFTKLVDLSTGFTGAEIGAAVKAAKVELFCTDRRDVNKELVAAFELTEPQFRGKPYDCGDVNARLASYPEEVDVRANRKPMIQ